MHTDTHALWFFLSPGVKACSVMVVWNLLPPAETKRINSRFMSQQPGIKREQNVIKFSVEAESF